MSLDQFHGLELCRDLPDIVRECIDAYLYEKETEEEDASPFGHREEMEDIFGLRSHLSLNGSTASALNGPFLNLLFFHPVTTLSLIIEILNRASKALAERGNAERNYVAPPFEIEIELFDRSKRTVYCNDRLWMMYRAAGVAPHVLESALMALESWLLLLGRAKNADLQKHLTKIVAETNNAALLAVVASVATAFPEQAGHSAFAVISHPTFYHLDVARMVHESAALEDIFPFSRTATDILVVEERRASRRQAHRKKSIEDLCRDLQFTEMRGRIWELIDHFRTDAGGDEPATTHDAIWLGIVHRMDIRKFAPVKSDEKGTFFAPIPLPPAIDEKIAPHRPQMEAQGKAMSLLNWGMLAFRHDPKANIAGMWREMLAQAQAAAKNQETAEFLDGGAGYVAAVVIRDCWDQMTPDEQQWCVTKIAGEIAEDACTESEHTAIQMHPSCGDRPSAFVASKVLALNPDDEGFREIVAVALTHAVGEVRHLAATGFKQEFASKDPTEFLRVLKCFVNAWKSYAEILAEQQKVPWDKRQNVFKALLGILKHAQKEIEARADMSDASLATVGIETDGADLYGDIIADWLAALPQNSVAKDYFERNAALLVNMWTDKDRDRHSDSVQAFEKSLARYLLGAPREDSLRVVEKIAGTVAKASQEVGSFLGDLTLEADNIGAIDRYWDVWPIFLKHTLALDPKDLAWRHDRIVEKLFLEFGVSGDKEDWPLLRGRESTLTELYRSMPVSADNTTLALRYFKGHGKTALPAAFVVLAEKIVLDPTDEHLTRNNVLLLEQLLSVRIFATPFELKEKPAVRSAILQILDALVNVGSSAAFIMRDDFATPASPSK